MRDLVEGLLVAAAGGAVLALGYPLAGAVAIGSSPVLAGVRL